MTAPLEISGAQYPEPFLVRKRKPSALLQLARLSEAGNFADLRMVLFEANRTFGRNHAPSQRPSRPVCCPQKNSIHRSLRRVLKRARCPRLEKEPPRRTLPLFLGRARPQCF